MSRAIDTLQKIHNEITIDPKKLGYSNKSMAEMAILMNQSINYEPTRFITTTPDLIDVLIKKNLTATQKDVLKSYVILQGLANNIDFVDVTTEIKAPRSDFLELGEVTQGDIEQALLT